MEQIGETSNPCANINDIPSNSNHTFISPTAKAIQGVAFATHFLAFIKQMVKGSVLPAYDYASDKGQFTSASKEDVLDMMKNPNLIMEIIIHYINECWHSYNTQKDEYIVKKIDNLLKLGNFKHSYCLFDYIWNFAEKILVFIISRFEVSHLKDKAFLSDCFDILIDGISSLQCDDLIKNEVKCNDECEVKDYKSDEDFIKIRNLSILK